MIRYMAILKNIIASTYQVKPEKNGYDIFVFGMYVDLAKKEAGQATYPEKPLEPSRACLRVWDCPSLKKILLETNPRGIVYHAFKLKYFGAAEPVLLSY